MDETTREITKTAPEGVRATKKLGAFIARLVQEPADDIVEILTDRLRFARWRRQERLLVEMEKSLQDRNLHGDLLPVPLKIALAILENAAIEEDDSLQDLWAKLLAAAADPAMQSKVRIAFIEVIRQFDAIDAMVLNYCHEQAQTKLVKFKNDYQWKYEREISLAPNDFGVSSIEVQRKFHLPTKDYRTSIDNLMRLRCMAPYLEEEDVEAEGAVQASTHNRQYDEVCVTPFGCSLVETCMWR
jgi:hypothetical protein